MTLKNFSPNAWVPDIGASACMIGNSDMLKNLHHYFGIYAIIIGECSIYAITHISDTYINNGKNKIKLQDVLLVKAQAKILTTDYSYNYEFYGVGIIIKK